jgi:hypothetical protein
VIRRVRIAVLTTAERVRFPFLRNLKRAAPATTVGDVSEPALRIVDEEQNEVTLDEAETAALLAITVGLEAATVSACPDCHSRVLAAVALVDLVEISAPHPRAAEIMELADEAPTLHLYVVDEATDCRHRSWLDPLYAEWLDVVDGASGPPVR